MGICEKQFFVCDCKHRDHMLLVSSELDEDYSFLSFEVLLNPMPWYKRIPIAVRYLLGYRATYSSWDATLLGPEETRVLAAFIYRFLTRSEQPDTDLER